MYKYNVLGIMYKCIEWIDFVIKICVNKKRLILFFIYFIFMMLNMEIFKVVFMVILSYLWLIV